MLQEGTETQSSVGLGRLVLGLVKEACVRFPLVCTRLDSSSESYNARCPVARVSTSPCRLRDVSKEFTPESYYFQGHHPDKDLEFPL